jgi:protein involved in polysaccharide export with SLBB domain
VLGEVTEPGVYPALSARKRFDMSSAAGGTTPEVGAEHSDHTSRPVE